MLLKLGALSDPVKIGGLSLSDPVKIWGSLIPVNKARVKEWTGFSAPLEKDAKRTRT